MLPHDLRQRASRSGSPTRRSSGTNQRPRQRWRHRASSSGFARAQPAAEVHLHRWPSDRSGRNINGYLADGARRSCIERRSTPLGASRRMVFGSMPTDGGHLILSPAERDAAARRGCPERAASSSATWVATSSSTAGERYCLWIADDDAAAAARSLTIARAARSGRGDARRRAKRERRAGVRRPSAPVRPGRYKPTRLDHRPEHLLGAS